MFTYFARHYDIVRKDPIHLCAQEGPGPFDETQIGPQSLLLYVMMTKTSLEPRTSSEIPVQQRFTLKRPVFALYK